MGADPRTSVVDCNLRIHGLENMYVASSSVFRTTGQANSTLPAVALGLRLVHHLHQETGRQATSDLAAYQLETR
jgi:choline dehydrogenase-like flavoprotein